MSVTCPKCRSENTDTSRFCADCGTRLGLPETPPQVSATRTLETPRETLGRGILFAGRYEVIEALGVGGMGEVYRVEDKKVRQEVALKLIKPEIAANKKTVDRFRNELKTARMISHRNVCRMYDLGEEKGTYFITMEYVAGEDLKSFMRRSKQLALGTAISIAKQISEGLTEAHRLGVVHRDLKPGNIMIDKEGSARIMDFGIARSLEAKGMTREGVIVGTPEFMSPEQMEGKDVDQRSDIYSLGVILYEMVTGRLPFEGDTPFTVGLKQMSEPPKNPKEWNPQILDALSFLILKSLNKDREKRYQNIMEFLSDLMKAEKYISTAERIPEKKYPIIAGKIAIRSGLKKILISVLVVFIGMIIWITILQPSKQNKSGSLVIPSKSVLTGLVRKKIATSVDNCTIKATPKIQSKTVARVSLGTILKSEEKIGEWYKVNLEKEGIKITGFIHEMLVKEIGDITSVKVIVDNASIKEDPAITSKTIARVPIDTILEVQDRTGEWYKVIWEKEGIQITGFIHELLVVNVR